MDHHGDQFTAHAQQVLAMAREEADRLQHEYIGTEHLLLALTRQERGGVPAVFQRLAVDVARVRETVEAIVKRGRATSTSGVTLPYTTRTQKALELARQSARELGHSHLGAEHLLVGLLREARGIAGAALLQHGLTEKAVIAEVERLQGGGGAHTP